MTQKNNGASVPDQALVASDQVNLRCLDPLGFDPSRVERVARAIAAGKRDPRTPPEEIDRVWTAYCGQARAALAADDSALANENADLIHDLERQMTIANIECNVAESARDALRQCARLARMESSSLATAIVETVNNALASGTPTRRAETPKSGSVGEADGGPARAAGDAQGTAHD